MKYTITAVRSREVVWSGGTFKKFEVKTDKTDQVILESRLGEKKNAKLKVGDVVEAYIEDSFYMGNNGRVETKILKAISAEYVYKLLLKLAPNIESVPEPVKTPSEPMGGTSNEEEPGF